MKVEEQLRLMVGDIIYACYNEEGVDFRVPVIVDAIEKLGHDDCFIDWHPLGSEDSSEVHAEEFDLIPLTAEILEKNGFTKRSKEPHLFWYKMDMGEYHLEINHNGIGVWTDYDKELYLPSEYNMPAPKCVHELQHALRLCGLNDLADNFKV